jgi:hypothetical protein
LPVFLQRCQPLSTANSGSTASCCRCGWLSAEAAADRTVAEVSLGRQAARAEVDGFLRD